MQSIGIDPKLIEEFEKEYCVMIFSYGWEDKAELIGDMEDKLIMKVEEEHPVLVWGVMQEVENIGREDDDRYTNYLLFVSEDKTKWEKERQELLNMEPEIYNAILYDESEPEYLGFMHKKIAMTKSNHPYVTL